MSNYDISINFEGATNKDVQNLFCDLIRLGIPPSDGMRDLLAYWEHHHLKEEDMALPLLSTWNGLLITKHRDNSRKLLLGRGGALTEAKEIYNSIEDFRARVLSPNSY
jgi:hypothetical protein